MPKTSPAQKQTLKVLNNQLKSLQGELVTAKKLEGIDDYIAIKVQKDKARFERIKTKGEEDKALGHFFIKIDIKAKAVDVFIPLSIASGKKVTGFMYQIEGTAEGGISTADVECRGEGVTQVTLGTLLYAKIPAGKTATFSIQASIKGKFGKTYKIIINRINYKLALTEARYTQYIKEVISDSVKFS